MTPESFIENYKSALASQSWASVEPLIHADACVTFSTGAVHKGLPAIKEAYERNFSLIKSEVYNMTDVHWALKDKDVAVYIFAFNWQGIINGSTASGKGRGTAIIKFYDGKWKLIAEHLGPA